MLVDNPMPPGAVSDAVRCLQRSRGVYPRLPWWLKLWFRVAG
jgi:hypothetical protein